MLESLVGFSCLALHNAQSLQREAEVLAGFFVWSLFVGCVPLGCQFFQFCLSCAEITEIQCRKPGEPARKEHQAEKHNRAELG